MKKLFPILFLLLLACSKDPVLYKLTATSNPPDGGTVSPSNQDYADGTVANITASPSTEYIFQNWTGSASGSSPTTTVTMDSDKSVIANFVKKKYPLTVEVEGQGSVAEKVIKAGLATDYNSGTIVELTATAETGWEFKEWTGDLTGTDNPSQITIDAAKTVKAVFTTSVEGAVQKGPYLSGTKLTIYELNEDLTQTGKSFTSEIIDDTGRFSVDGLNLVSDLVRINADGYYFNEVSGSNSNAQLSLSLLAKIGGSEKINVNVITALERPRVEYLVKNEQMAFDDARKKAQSEILKIFEIENNNLGSSETFDITQTGDGNAILLAISSIIQGYRTDSEVSELISNIATDISEDGKLDSKISGSQLLSHADFLIPQEIKGNIEDKYEKLGKTINTPSFSNLIENFVNDSSFEKNHLPISYSSEFNGRQNILFLDKNNYLHSDISSSEISGSGYMVAVSADVLSENGSLKIEIESLTYPNVPSGDMPPVGPNNFNWKTSDASNSNVRISRGEYLINYYEMSNDIITRTKKIKIDYDLENDYTFVPDIKFERRLEYYKEMDLGWNLKDKYVKTIFMENEKSLEIKEGTTFFSKDNWQIENFKGLENMKNLEKLILSDNDAVKTIDISSLTKLTEFDATECDNLTCIIVSQEQLDNIPSRWKKPTNAEYKLSCD